MEKTRLEKLLEVYSLEELLHSMDLEPAEALEVLVLAGYEIEVEEPL